MKYYYYKLDDKPSNIDLIVNELNNTDIYQKLFYKNYLYLSYQNNFYYFSKTNSNINDLVFNFNGIIQLNKFQYLVIKNKEYLIEIKPISNSDYESDSNSDSDYDSDSDSNSDSDSDDYESEIDNIDLITKFYLIDNEIKYHVANLYYNEYCNEDELVFNNEIKEEYQEILLELINNYLDKKNLFYKEHLLFNTLWNEKKYLKYLKKNNQFINIKFDKSYKY